MAAVYVYREVVNMATDWREFGRDLSNELINNTFATARLACEIDLLTTGGGDWQTGGSSVSQTFVGDHVFFNFYILRC